MSAYTGIYVSTEVVQHYDIYVYVSYPWYSISPAPQRS